MFRTRFDVNNALFCGFMFFFAYDIIRLVTYKKTRTYLKVHFYFLQLFKCEQELLIMSGVANNSEKGRKRKRNVELWNRNINKQVLKKRWKVNFVSFTNIFFCSIYYNMKRSTFFSIYLYCTCERIPKKPTDKVIFETYNCIINT